MNRIFKLSTLCLLLISTEALCQADTIKTFFDSDWNELSDSTNAEFRRVVYRHDVGFWKVIDYYKSGRVRMDGAFSEKEMKWPYGNFEYYYPDGQLMSKTTYSNGRPTGESFTYYENGQIDQYQKFDSSGQIEEERLYKEDGTDSVREQPEFPGGIESMYRYLSRRTKYPKSLRKRSIGGKVYITFVVHTDGSLQDVRIIDSPDEAFSQEAIKVVRSMPKWKPGSRDGESVRVKYNLPITFSPN